MLEMTKRCNRVKLENANEKHRKKGPKEESKLDGVENEHYARKCREGTNKNTPTRAHEKQQQC